MHKGKKRHGDKTRSKSAKKKAKARKQAKGLARAPSPIVEAMVGARY